MRDYEVTYILDPTAEEEQITALIERYQNLVSSNGGEIAGVDRWEKRKLAYEIDGKREGIYVVMTFKANPAEVAEMDRQMRLSESVIRHLIVRPDVVKSRD